MDITQIVKSKRRPPPPPPPKPKHLVPKTPRPKSSKKGLGWPWDTPPAHLPLYNLNLHSSPPPTPWLFNWELWVPPSLPNSIDWVPCVRTAAQAPDITPFLTDITTTQGRTPTALLGFNEPEIPDQANLPVDEAVKLWKEYVLPAKTRFGLRLGSPGVSSDIGRSQPWLDDFFNQLDGEDGVDFLVLHWYGERFEDMKSFLEGMYRRYVRPVWVNEFACSKMGDGETGEDKVCEFLREAVDWLEGTEWVERYAYYGNGQGRDGGTWVGRGSNFTEVADGCEGTDGRRLSKVGELYLGV